MDWSGFFLIFTRIMVLESKGMGTAIYSEKIEQDSWVLMETVDYSGLGFRAFYG